MTERRDIETMITLDYRKKNWGIERIVLDSISNHLPQDSKGSEVRVLIVQGGFPCSLKEANPDRPAEQIVFSDDGEGYDAGLLSILFSTKSADGQSVGQFGEGLKLVAAAALREGIDIEYMSRNWVARPFAKKETVGGHEIERLCFAVDINGYDISGAMTVFKNPSPALLREVLQLPEKVLALNDDYRDLTGPRTRRLQKNEFSRIFMYFQKEFNAPFDETVESAYNRLKDMIEPAPSDSPVTNRIIDLGSGKKYLFIKGILVEKDIRALFSYDLNLDDITPDRKFADRKLVMDAVRGLVLYASNPDVRRMVLMAALEKDADFYELDVFGSQSFDSVSELKQISIYAPKVVASDYVSTFVELFGPKALVASENPDLNKDAEVQGYNPVKLRWSVGKFLSDHGAPTVDELLTKSEYRWVDSAVLTDEEREVLSKAPRIAELVCGRPVDVDVRVYEGLFTSSGVELGCSNGVHFKERGGAEYIGIKRSRLQSLPDFVDTYIHELGHDVTGAGDYDRKFTSFFTEALARMIVDRLKG